MTQPKSIIVKCSCPFSTASLDAEGNVWDKGCDPKTCPLGGFRFVLERAKQAVGNIHVPAL